jgi:hypothetical protein
MGKLKYFGYGFCAGVIISASAYGAFVLFQPVNKNIPDKKDVIKTIDDREKELKEYADKTKKLSDRIDLYLDNAVDYPIL